MKTAGSVFAAAAVAVLAVAAVAPAGRALAGRVDRSAALQGRADISSNWSGYVAAGPGSTATTASPAMAYTDVTGQWVEPRAACVPGSPSSVAIWVGLGGYSESSNDLEQAGTSADCGPNGSPSYYAWYELVPANSVTIKTLQVFPGDSAKVTECEYLGAVRIRSLRSAPRGAVRVGFEFAVGEEGLLTVTAKDLESGRAEVVKLATRDTPESLRAKLQLEAAPRAPRGARPIEPTRAAAPPERKGLFGKLFGSRR